MSKAQNLFAFERDALSTIIVTGSLTQTSTNRITCAKLRDETAGNLEPKTCCSGVTSLNWESRRFQIKPVPVNGLLFGRDS